MKSLAIKYRPKHFSEVVEQDAIKKILCFQLETESTKNCYLMVGAAGTGKTTCARIFANDLNKNKGSPIEIDGASNNGVENVRDIIDNAKFKSLDSEYKIYIIDECHQLSIGAWNAMLKLIEEPPEKTIFIFCTTDPQKIPATILSRVQRYDFQRISFDGIVNRLLEIIASERYELFQGDEANLGDLPDYGYEIEAIYYIAKLADGGLRDAITLLDKCISYSTILSVENITTALGITNYDVMFELLTHLLNVDELRVIACIESIYNSGVDLKAFIKQFIYFIVDINKYEITQSFDYINISSSYKEYLDNIVELNTFTNILSLLDLIIKLNADIKWENQPKAIIEATFMLWCNNL